MPFSAVASPAIGLTQLKAVVEKAFPGRFDIAIHYLNHDFHRFLDDPWFYGHVMSNAGYATGLGDWLFRQAAFPDAEENAGAYFEAYYPDWSEHGREVQAAVRRIRPSLERFLDQVIGDAGLAGAELVGFATMFSQTTPSVALARRMKERNPAVTTVIGGAACTGPAGMELARCLDVIDYVFSGSGLVSFPEFVGCWAVGDMAGCGRIDGVFPGRGRQPDGAAGGRAAGAFGREMDINEELPLDYDSFLDGFDRAFAASGLRPRLLFETSRGCWWGERSHCTFCGLNGPSMCYRAMSPEKALGQIRSVLRYAGRCRYFASTDNIIPESYFKELLPRLEVPEGVEIQYEVRPNLSGEQLGVLVRAGVKVIQPGIEALSSETLRLMHKGTSAFSNLRFLKECAKHPIFAGYSLLVFSPGESEGTYSRYLEVIPTLTHLPPPLAVYPIEFVRYSPYFEQATEHGLDLRPEPYYALTYPLDAESISRIASRFRDANADPARIRHWLGLLNESVEHWRSRWYGQDGRAQSRLCFAGEGEETVVYDSRSGQELEHPLTAGSKRVLEALELPLRPPALAARLAGCGVDTTEALGYLRERDLLFEEGGRAMSLVVG